MRLLIMNSAATKIATQFLNLCLRGCTVFNYGFAIVFHVCGLKIVNISFEALAKCCAMQAGVRFHGNWRFPI